MKQVIIRILPGINTVYDVVYGTVKDGQFTPSVVADDEFPIPPLVYCDNLLGGTSFVKTEDLFALVHYYMIRSSAFEFYPNFIVFTLNCSDHGTQEDSQTEER